MKTHQVSLINAIILIALSAWAYFTSENPSPTALIPGAVGVILVALNGGLKKENKVISHIVVLLTLLIIVALIMPLKSAISDSSQIRIIRVGIMMLSSIWAMIYFVRSFMAARKNQSA